MLPFFPVPYRDEWLYSMCARYARLTGYVNPRMNLYALFGRTTITAVGELPMHLGYLSAQLTQVGGPNADGLIDQHTLLPYYAAFHSPEKRGVVREEMRGRGNPLFRLGLMASRVPILHYLRYCPLCAEEDRTLHGEAYWHRLHQLSGVLTCPEHEVWLENSSVRLPSKHPCVYFTAEETVPRATQPRAVSEDRDRTPLLDVANRSRDLLEQPPIPLEPSELRRSYINALAARGLATYGESVRVRLLAPLFSEFLPPRLTELFGLGPSIVGNRGGWLLRLLSRSPSASHTLHHLILLAFLRLDRGELCAPIRHFGEGPWPCLNRASSHYLEARITNVAIDLTADAPQRPIGTFGCSCGFVYRRTGPDRMPEDRYRITKMAAYGDVWLEALRCGWFDPGLSLRALSDRLGFTTGTIVSQASKLGLPDQRPGEEKRKVPYVPRKPLPGPTFEQRRAAHRDTWLRARQNWPETVDAGALRRINTARAWLRKQDSEWYEHHRLPYVATQGQRRVDWKERDTQIAKQLRRTARELLLRTQPVRISRTGLARRLGHERLLSRHIDKLPQCEEVLAEVSDTRETFAIRRIHAAADRVRSSGEGVAWSTFRRMAGVRHDHLVSSDQLKEVFEQVYISLAN